MKRDRRDRIVVLLGLSLLLLVGCGGDSEPEATPPSTQEQPDNEDAGDDSSGLSVSAVDNSFEPASISVPAGEEITIEFTNDGQSSHTFTSSELDVDSGSVKPDDSTTLTFTSPDSATQFVCSIHGPSMSGQIVPE